MAAELPVRVLVVDDDADIVEILIDRLESQGHAVASAADGEEAMKKIREEPPRLVLLDLQMPRMTGMEVLKAIRAEKIPTTVIVISGFGTIERAVAAIKEGAFDFITKPFDYDHMRIVIEKALEREALIEERKILRDQLSSQFPPEIIGKSESISKIIDTAKKVSMTNSTVLILGESGTGKEVFARAIHAWSPRADRPFMPVNCVALTEQLLESELFGHEKGSFTGAHQQKKGKLEVANGGTVFLDEIGDLNPALQTKLLRVLQEHEFERVGGTKQIKVDIRVIAATNRDLTRAMKEGRFREDLYYRLNVIAFTIPPLRERREDIPDLANYFLKWFDVETKKSFQKISDEAMEILMLHSWRGNVRELENVIERAVVLGEGEVLDSENFPVEITESSLAQPPNGPNAHSVRNGAGLTAVISDLERRRLQEALERARGNKSEAARLLGLRRSTFFNKLKKHGLL